MSFILDALRRADAQRERHSAGGLHAQAIPMPDDDAAAPRWRTRSLVLAGVLVAGAVVAALWTWPGRAPRVGPATPVGPVASAEAAGRVPAPAQAPVGLAARPAPADAVLPPPALVRTNDGPPVTSSRRPPPAEPAGAPGAAEPPNDAAEGMPAPPRSARTMPLPGTAEPGAGAAAAAATPPAPPAPAAPAPAPAGAAPAARSSALPAGAPRVVVSGGVYSRDAASRMVIVNGQVFGEGAEPVAGVTIEQIQPNRAVLRYQGQRYTVSY